MTIQEQAEHLIQEKEIELMQRDIMFLKDELAGLKREMDAILAGIREVERLNLSRMQEAES